MNGNRLLPNLGGYVSLKCDKFQVGKDTIYVNTSNNSVGIGTKTPVEKLDVTGNTNITGSYKIANTTILTGNTLGSGVVSSNLSSVGTLTSLTVAGDLTVDTNTLHVDSANNRVGVGTVSPAYTLEVAGDVNTTGAFKVNGVNLLSNTTLSNSITSVGTLTSLTVSGDLTVDTSTLVVDSANNRVGVGTASPAYTLDVKDNTATANTDLIVMSALAPNVSDNYSTYSYFGRNVSSGSSNCYVQRVKTGTQGFYQQGFYGGTYNNIIGFSTGETRVYLPKSFGNHTFLNANGANSYAFFDSTNFRLGINNTSPSYTLDVTGDINLSAASSVRIGGTATVTSSNLGGITTLNNVNQMRATHSSTTGHSLGAGNIVNATNNGYANTQGTFQRWFGWDAAGTSHTINYNYLCVNSGNDNWAGTIRIFASNKANTNVKVGVLTCDLLKAYSANLEVATISTTKNSNLTTLTATNSANDVVVTTDSDCLVSWVIIGGI